MNGAMPFEDCCGRREENMPSTTPWLLHSPRKARCHRAKAGKYTFRCVDARGKTTTTGHTRVWERGIFVPKPKVTKTAGPRARSRIAAEKAPKRGIPITGPNSQTLAAPPAAGRRSRARPSAAPEPPAAWRVSRTRLRLAPQRPS